MIFENSSKKGGVVLKGLIGKLCFVVCICLLSACTETQFRANIRPPKLEVTDLAAYEILAGDKPLPADVAVFRQQNSLELPLRSFSAYPGHIGPVNSLSVSSDGWRLLSGGQDGQVFEFLAERDESINRVIVKRRKLLEGRRPILSLALSSDQKFLAVAQFSSVSIIDLEKRELVAQLSRVVGRILSIAWDPRGESVVLGRANGDMFLWDLKRGPYAGSDNDNALEVYQGATSPIIDIKFHPSGRAFFAAEREGRVYFWRILRTERELGLRDESALIDRTNRRGGTQILVGALPGQIAHLNLSPDGLRLSAQVLKGPIYSWRVRGLQAEPTLQVESNAASAFVGGFESLQSGLRSPVFYAAGRGQRFTIWCRELKPEYREQPKGFAVVSGGVATGTQGQPKSLLAHSPLFASSITELVVGDIAPVVWGAQQDGSIFAYDSSYGSAGVRRRLQYCRKGL